MKNIFLENLRRIEYGEAWDLQEDLLKNGVAEKIRAGKESDYSYEFPNYLLLCEHPHVYTLGKHGNVENLLLSSDKMNEKHISFYRTNRGGDITYHGPGQLVAYPILDLEQFLPDLRKYMFSLEEVVIKTIAEYGIIGDRLPGSTGVWLEPQNPEKARKICALGVRCSRWITIHGLALNVNTDLTYFEHIVPCGISDKKVTGMNLELNRKINEKELQQIFLEKFAEVFEAQISPIEKSLLSLS